MGLSRIRDVCQILAIDGLALFGFAQPAHVCPAECTGNASDKILNALSQIFRHSCIQCVLERNFLGQRLKSTTKKVVNISAGPLSRHESLIINLGFLKLKQVREGGICFFLNSAVL